MALPPPRRSLRLRRRFPARAVPNLFDLAIDQPRLAAHAAVGAGAADQRRAHHRAVFAGAQPGSALDGAGLVRRQRRVHCVFGFWLFSRLAGYGYAGRRGAGGAAQAAYRQGRGDEYAEPRPVYFLDPGDRPGAGGGVA